jgi:hypothetical protein
MAQHAPPPTAPRKAPPSWWWFAAPVLLMIAAGVVGVGAFVSTMHEISTRYGEVRADGEPHALSVPREDRAMLMIPTSVNRTSWDCRVTDDSGATLPTTDRGGNVSFANEASSWESLLTFDPGDAGDGPEVTVYVACRSADADTSQTVLLTKAPEVSAMVARVAVMILGPLALGGAAFVWFVVLVVLQVVRRSESS